MTVFIADETGSVEGGSPRLRLVRAETGLIESPEGASPDALIDASDGEGEHVCVQQSRRHFFLGRPRPWDRPLRRVHERVAAVDGGQVEISALEHDRYLRHLARVSDRTLAAELGDHAFIANGWDFGEASVAAEYLDSIATRHPGDDAYLDAWHDMRAVLAAFVGRWIVDEALDATSGYLNNCFVTTWEEFRLYQGFLAAVLERLADYREVDRLFGYLTERILTVYLAHRAEACRRFSVDSRPTMLAA